MSSKLLKKAYKLVGLNQLEAQSGGWILIAVMVMSVFLTAVAISIASLSATQYQDTKSELDTQNAQLLAEAGIEQTVNELNSNSSFSGYTSPQEFFDNSTQGYGTFTTTITNDSGSNAKTILSTGDVYQAAGDATPYLTKKISVTVVGTTSNGYSVSTGPGGLILGGSASITNSNVYVNGTISMSGASEIGTDSNPVTVDVANDACPTGSNPGSSYPEVCTNGSQPISFSGSPHIYGSVCATGQTSTGSQDDIQGGDGGSGLEANCTAPVVSMPSYNWQSQINAVTTTASGTSNTYVCNDYPFNRTWPSNLELTGDVTVGGSCDVTVDGDVYVTGNLTIDGDATMTVASSAGTNEPVILVDGTITVDGSASMIANADGTGMEFISLESAASCSPSCTSVTGTDLYNSQQLQTISVSGAANLPGMVFDAYWGEATLSGSGKVGAITGQTVNLSGAGTIIFGTELSSGAETWSITSYQPLDSS